MKTEDHQALWNRNARRLARRMNTGFWLAAFLPLLFAAGLGQSFALVWLRKNEMASGPAWMIFGVLVLAAGVFAWHRQRGRFFSRRDALVYLEARLGLNNGLTAADDGISGWPERRPVPARVLPVWSWKRIAPWPVWTLAMIALALWLPVTPATSLAPEDPVEPTAWSGIDSWIETLEDAEVFEEAALEDFREQVESLRRQDPEDWYDHSSLEATDALRQRTENAIREALENLEKTARAFDVASEYPEGLPSGWEAALREELQEAIEGLESGLLRLDPELLALLREVDLSSLPMMSEEEMRELGECLAAGIAAGGLCLGTGPGTGGIGKGPGPAPLTFRENRAEDTVSRFESASNDDMSRAALGDRIGVGEREIPDDDRAPYTGPAAAGAVAGSGTGGEAVSRQNFTPDEQAVLERYFD